MLATVCTPKPVDQLDQLPQIDRSQNIDGWNVRLYFLSRNPRFLFWISVVILLIGFGGAWFLQKPLEAVLQEEDFKAETLKRELAKEKPDADAVLIMLPRAANLWLEEAPADQWIESSKLSQTDKMVAMAYWTSLRMEDGFEPSADLLYYAYYVNPLRHANELIGDHYLAQKDLPKAVTYYQREAKFPDATKARSKLVDAAMAGRDRAVLRALAENPGFEKEFRPEHRLYFAAQERRWADLVLPLKEIQSRLIEPIPVALATLAGLVWLIIALQAIQPPGIFSFRVILPILCVVAGMASTFPTLLSGLWMQEMFGLRHSGDVVDDVLFFVLSVGPREEVAKLALFLPFVPILLFRKSRLEMLVAAGCVGLGFAVWENLIYFRQFGSAVAFPRFLTANFFHLALTGLNGLAFCDLLRNPVRGFFPFIWTFILTVAAHGAYDALASLEHLRIMMLGAMIIYMLIALWFLRKLRTLRDGSTDQFSIGATFVIGISLLAATILMLASREIGFIPTLVVFTIVGFGMIMVSYMFYWQLGEGMSTADEAPASPYYR
jgi:RsiW-degrading membrane proteinase PrsW (M82 family)